MDRKLLALATVALGATQPAAAQLAPLSPPAVSLAKSEAILGGTSKLAALIAQQSGQPLPAIAAAAAPQPAGFGRTVRLLGEPELFRPTVSKDRPDVFGTVALAVGQTSLDRRWRRVQRSGAGAIASRWAASLRDRTEADRIDAVNRYVNARVRFIDDNRQYRTADVWQSAADTLRRGRGDCEDYAIAKLQLLRSAGFADEDLYLVIVNDLVRRADHAVLVVRSGDRMMLLDNATDQVTDATAFQDYRPMLSYTAAGKSWTHGYRRAAPINVASGPAAATAVAAIAGTTTLR